MPHCDSFFDCYSNEGKFNFTLTHMICCHWGQMSSALKLLTLGKSAVKFSGTALCVELLAWPFFEYWKRCNIFRRLAIDKYTLMRRVDKRIKLIALRSCIANVSVLLKIMYFWKRYLNAWIQILHATFHVFRALNSLNNFYKGFKLASLQIVALKVRYSGKKVQICWFFRTI